MEYRVLSTSISLIPCDGPSGMINRMLIHNGTRTERKYLVTVSNCLYSVDHAFVEIGLQYMNTSQEF